MKTCDLWKDNMLVIAEIESISRFKYICKKDLEVGSWLYSILEKEDVKIYIISDELYKKLFNLTTEQLYEFKAEFDYYNNEGGIMYDLFHDFIFTYYLIEANAGDQDFYFVTDDIYFGTLRINENKNLVLYKNPQYNKENSKKYIEIYKHLYNEDYEAEEAIDIIKKLYPKSKFNKQDKVNQKILKK